MSLDSTAQEKVLAALNGGGWRGPREIREATGLLKIDVVKSAEKLVKSRQVKTRMRGNRSKGGAGTRIRQWKFVG